MLSDMGRCFLENRGGWLRFPLPHCLPQTFSLVCKTGSSEPRGGICPSEFVQTFGPQQMILGTA